MPFSALESLAADQAAADERKRRLEAAALAKDEERLQQDALDQKRSAAEGPAGLLAELTGGKRGVAVAGNVQRAAEEDQFLNEQGTRRLERRATGLGDRKADLSVPGESAGERYRGMTAGLGRFANEDPTLAAAELRTNRGGREADLDTILQQLQGGRRDVPRETSPIYTDAPRARRGDDETMPYAGGVEGLRGAEVSRSAIAPEYGGTGGGVLRFSDRPEPGMRRYNAPSGRTKDVGAPGGGLGTVGDGSDASDPVRQAQISDVTALRDQASRARLTPPEMAADLAEQLPAWDQRAAASGPGEVESLINDAIASRQLRPETGQYLQRRYSAVANEAFDQNGEYQPDIWHAHLTQGRPPAPGEAEARAKMGGLGPAQAAQAEHAAVQNALQAPQDGPGSTQSPALKAESEDPRDALLASIQGTSTPVPQATPGAGPSQRRPMTGGPGVDSLDQLLEQIFGAGRGVNPANAVDSRQRDALLRQLTGR